MVKQLLNRITKHSFYSILHTSLINNYLRKMHGAYHLPVNGPFSNIVEEEKKHRFCKLHLQSWVYIHCIISMVTSMVGIGLGVLLLLKTEWHEKLFIYRLVLAYIRRSDPIKYWLLYRIFFSIWIIIHFSHMATIFITIVAVQKTSINLLKPQLYILVFQIGIFLIGLSGVLLISVTGSRPAWGTVSVVIFHLFFASSNLILLATYHRLLDDNLMALNEILIGQSKTVHFKENSSEY